jgi:hypothetical protein
MRADERGNHWRRLAVTGVTMALIAALGSGMAAASTSTKFYSASISPTSAAPSTSVGFTVTLTNSATSTQALGSANVTVPSAFTSVVVTGVIPPAGKTWSAALVSGVIQLRNPGPSTTNALAPGQAVSVTFTATTPSVAGTYLLPTQAKQSNDFNGFGNNFVLLGANPTVTIGTGVGPLASIVLSPASASVGAGGSVTFSATGYDADGNSLGDVTADTTFSITPDGSCTGPTCTATVVGPHTVTGTDGAFSATAALAVAPGAPDHLAYVQPPTDAVVNTSMAPAVTVVVLDAYGNTVTASTAAVTVALGANPSGATLSGSSTCPAGPGTVCQNASGGVATFSDLSLNKSGTNFTLVATSPGLTQATSGTFAVFLVSVPCPAAGCTGATGSDSNPGNPTIVIATVPARVDAGTLDLGSDPASESQFATFCGGAACMTGSFIMTVLPPANSPYTQTQFVTIVLEYDKSISGKAGASSFNVWEDGVMLPDCPSSGDPTQSCVSHRNRDLAGDLLMTVLAQATPQDPGFGTR